MSKPRSSSQDPQIRFLVAYPCSGSTLLMRSFAESLLCGAISLLVLMSKVGSRDSFSPDCSTLDNPSYHSVFINEVKLGQQVLICKEEVGIDGQKRERLYDLCSDPAVYVMVRPIFLSRDPVRVFDSRKNVAWTDTLSLIDCYTNTFHMLHRAPSYAVSYLIHERLIQDHRTEIKQIFARRGVRFAEIMLNLKHSFGSSFIFLSDREGSIYCKEKPLGLFSTVEASSSVQPDVPYHDLLSNTGKNIQENVDFLYFCCWRDDFLRLRTILTEKIWIGFDLDDTLHEFRRSSGTAIDKVLAEISKQYGTPIVALKNEYSRVLKVKTANAFSDGKTSFDYLRERFTSVLARLSLPRDDQFIAKLLVLYENTLMMSLELKCGALDILSVVKAMGKKVVVIMEGPQDAQERTIQRLGIEDYIDFVATTTRFRVTKTDGLFSRVLEHLGISPGDIAYIGDNEERDMKPTLAEGIFPIHLAETKHVSLNTIPPRINTLRKLQYILSNDRPLLLS
ncbi:MAG: hypothetical protein Q9167_004913 [Letrouitia subvulpina]